MFNAEKEAVQTIIVRNMLGHKTDAQGLHTYSLIDEEGVSKLANRVSAKIWVWFTGFGNVMSGMLGIFFVLRMIKWIFDTWLNFLSLKSVYGLSFALFAAIWDSLTLCLLHKRMTTKEENIAEMELTNILIKSDENSHCVDNLGEQKPLQPKEVSEPTAPKSEMTYMDLNKALLFAKN